MKITFLLVLLLVFLVSFEKNENRLEKSNIYTASSSIEATFEEKLADAAVSIISKSVYYDPTYFNIKYPNGDIPANKGVCTDVVIRTYRKLNIDLQKAVHEDMKDNFTKYPSKLKWGLRKTDTNIDHRRVPNLEVFFTRKGQKLGISKSAADYKTGDIVTWMINKKLPHIGIVSNKKSSDGNRLLLVHNIGGGQVLEDCLFDFPIVGHFKYKK